MGIVRGKFLFKICCPLLLFVFFLGCATVPPARKEPTKEPAIKPRKEPPVKEAPKVVPEPLPAPVQEKPVVEKDPFEAFPGKYRIKAVEFERKQELGKALLSWQVVHRFKPEDRESAERIKTLDARIHGEANRHFLLGLDYYGRNSIQAARKEFLTALAYDPEHGQALDYLEHKLNEPDFIMYETKEGDTLSRVAKAIYHGSDEDFLIVYFNDLDRNDRLTPGMVLKLPNIESARVVKASYAEEMSNEAKSLFRAKKYEKAVSLAEKILEYDPSNNEANDLKNASYYQLGTLLFQKKEYRDSLRMFKKVDIGFKNVRERVASLEKYLKDEQGRAEEHYNEGVRLFLAEKLDGAIKEWEETLRLDPQHLRAKRDLEKARRLKENLKKLQ